MSEFSYPHIHGTEIVFVLLLFSTRFYPFWLFTFLFFLSSSSPPSRLPSLVVTRRPQITCLPPRLSTQIFPETHRTSFEGAADTRTPSGTWDEPPGESQITTWSTSTPNFEECDGVCSRMRGGLLVVVVECQSRLALYGLFGLWWRDWRSVISFHTFFPTGTRRGCAFNACRSPRLHKYTCVQMLVFRFSMICNWSKWECWSVVAPTR